MADIADTNAGAVALPSSHFDVLDRYFGSVDGSFEVAGDADRYKISLLAGTAYTFLVHLDGPGSTAATIQLLDAAGNVLQAGNATTNGEAAVTFTIPTDGDYFVRVAAPGTGAYEINFLSGAGAIGVGTLGNDTMPPPGGHFFSGGDGNDQVAFTGSGYEDASGGNGNDTLSGDSQDNVLFGGLGDDILTGHAGRNILVGGAGDDQLDNTDGTALGGGLSGWLQGGAGDDLLTGSSFDDLLEGGDGSDTLVGGAGANLLKGGDGNDIYLLTSGNDVVDETGTGGIDRVQWQETIDLADTTKFKGEVEWAVLSGTDNNDVLGNGLDNNLIGNSGNNVLNGRDGDDVLHATAGSDTLIGGNGDDIYDLSHAGTFTIDETATTGNDTVWAASNFDLSNAAIVKGAVENIVIVGSGAADVTGNALSNRLDGSLNGSANALTGLAGDDIYLVGTGDTVIEAPGGGTDTVGTFVNFTLPAEVENLVMLGSTAINGTGNGLANSLDGTLNTSANVLTGLAGDDTYFVGAGDTVVESPNGGLDAIVTSIAYTLPNEVEVLSLRGTDPITGTGNAFSNALDGAQNSAANVLRGLGGNDTYIVGAGDVVIEAAGAGTDVVDAAVNFVLGSNVENLTLVGSNAIAGTGNGLANVIDGSQNAKANLLKGLGGNDSYFVGAGDTVVEAAGGGTDVVGAHVSFTLGANVENLALLGNSTISGTGNSLANSLDGSVNPKANVLRGLAGNDTYLVGAGDLVIEAAGGGTDVVRSLINYTLGANVEHLVLTSTANQNGNGNTLGNTIIGNAKNNVLSGGAGADVLRGMAGDDTLIGGTGIDSLTGGVGKDSFVFNAPLVRANGDAIADFNPIDDTFRLENSVMKALGGAGFLNPAFFFAGISAHDANDHIIYNRLDGALFYDADGTGAHAAIQLATLANKPAHLTAADFVVI